MYKIHFCEGSGRVFFYKFAATEAETGVVGKRVRGFSATLFFPQIYAQQTGGFLQQFFDYFIFPL
jgi:hypothetical protein